MDAQGNNYYQTCRICAGLTQLEASEAIETSVSHLAKIETDERVPSDDLVDRMAIIYNTPLLAWWHLRTHNPLGHHLPNVSPPQSDCDMAFQAVLMADVMTRAVGIIKEVLADGMIDPSENDIYEEFLRLIASVTDKGASIGVYAREE